MTYGEFLPETLSNYDLAPTSSQVPPPALTAPQALHYEDGDEWPPLTPSPSSAEGPAGQVEWDRVPRFRRPNGTTRTRSNIGEGSYRRSKSRRSKSRRTTQSQPAPIGCRSNPRHTVSQVGGTEVIPNGTTANGIQPGADAAPEPGASRDSSAEQLMRSRTLPSSMATGMTVVRHTNMNGFRPSTSSEDDGDDDGDEGVWAYGLRDRTYFPPYAYCPREEEPQAPYFEYTPSKTWRLARPWVYIGQIVNVGVDSDGRKVVICQDYVELEKRLHFGSWQNSDFTEGVAVTILIDDTDTDFVIGHVLALAFAQQYPWAPGLGGFRVVWDRSYAVLPVELTQLFRASDILVEDDRWRKFCENCDMGIDNNNIDTCSCSNCECTFYCSRHCQVFSWQERHRWDCEALKWAYALLRGSWGPLYNQYVTFRYSRPKTQQGPRSLRIVEVRRNGVPPAA